MRQARGSGLRCSMQQIETKDPGRVAARTGVKDETACHGFLTSEHNSAARWTATHFWHREANAIEPNRDLRRAW